MSFECEKRLFEIRMYFLKSRIRKKFILLKIIKLRIFDNYFLLCLVSTFMDQHPLNQYPLQ